MGLESKIAQMTKFKADRAAEAKHAIGKPCFTKTPPNAGPMMRPNEFAPDM